MLPLAMMALPLASGVLGGMMGGGKFGHMSAAPPGKMPDTGANYPGYGPQAWPGWPVPSATVPAPKQQWEGDLSHPGQAEQFFSDNKGAFTAPGKGDEYWAKNKGGFQGDGPAGQYWNGVVGSGQSAMPKSTNYAEQAYTDFHGSSPADMSPYYDNAQRKANESINQQMAARGMGRSSYALDQLSEASTNLRAQEAKDNAQYGLDRGGLLGNLSASADASSRGNNANSLNWLTGMGNLAGQADQQGLTRLMGGANIASGLDNNSLARLAGGMTGALGAQNALENRGQNFFTNNLAFGKATADPMQDIYMAMMGDDRQTMADQMAMALGVPREALNQDVMNEMMAMMKEGKDKAAGGGGGGGGGLLGGILGGGGSGGLLGGMLGGIL